MLLQDPLSVVDDNQKVVGALSVVGATKMPKIRPEIISEKIPKITFIMKLKIIPRDLTFSKKGVIIES